MSIIVNIKDTHNKDSNEYKAALELQSMFCKVQDVDGEIWIVVSSTLYNVDINDVDILLFGYFKHCVQKIECKAKQDPFKKIRDVFVRGFCVTLELKDHDISRIRYNGIELEVKYKNAWHSVEKQSNAGKYSLKNFLEDRKSPIPIITNIVWLHQVDKQGVDDLTNKTASNILPNEFTFNDLIKKISMVKIIVNEDTNTGKYYLNLAFDNEASFKSLVKIFTEIRVSVSTLTRKRLEMIDAKEQANITSAEKFLKDNKLHLFKGKAGTGKTIYLLRLACALAMDYDKRCKILTFNHALVSDMRRTLNLAHIPGGDDERTVQISTLHHFFISIMKALGTNRIEPEDANFEEHYIQSIRETNILIDQSDVDKLKVEYGYETDWDYVMVDEAQDWRNDEKQLLFKLYGTERIVVADGVDQFMRQNSHQLWGVGVDCVVKKENISLRQKCNLVNFMNAYANKFELDWEITPFRQLLGGKVIVSTYYDTDLHNSLIKECYNAGNSAYDLMFLVPPQLVNNSGFSLLHDFEQNNIHIFDGTNPQLRERYSTDMNQCRLYQYDSCRGLEGWIVVCLNFDQLLQYKIDSYRNEAKENISEEDIKERVLLWSLIPLTRAIDTLVITIDNTDSEIYHLLNTLSQDFSDIVELIN